MGGDDEEEGRSLFDILRALLGERHARELAQELWGLGYTITARTSRRDPFDIDPKNVPPGVGYQWVPTVELEHHAAKGWQPVPASRHDGQFAPIGSDGPATLKEMTLVERPMEMVDAVHEARIAGAQRNVDNWHKKFGGVFAGRVKVGTSETTAETRVVGDPEVAAQVSHMTKLPPELFAHAGAVFAERDRLKAEATETGQTITDADATAQAIAYVTKSLQQESAA